MSLPSSQSAPAGLATTSLPPQRFFASPIDDILPALCGTVDVEGDGNFFRETESTMVCQTLTDIIGDVQPPVFIPRSIWPQRDVVFSLTSDMPAGLENGAVQFHNKLPRWVAHLREVWATLQKLSTGKRLSQLEIFAMFHIIGRGLETMVYFSNEAMAIGLSASGLTVTTRPAPLNDEILAKKHLLSTKYPALDLYFGIYYSPDRVFEKSRGRRFIAGATFFNFGQNYGANHWGGYIFDKFRKVLYIFDSLLSGRGTRSRFVIQAWEQGLRLAAMPFQFDFLVVPCTAQGGGG